MNRVRKNDNINMVPTAFILMHVFSTKISNLESTTLSVIYSLLSSSSDNADTSLSGDGLMDTFPHS